MSYNKKNQNFSALLGDIRASSINDKLKGRNYKMYMKKITSNLDKSDLVSMKTLQNTNYSSEKLFTETKSNDKKLNDRRKVAGNSQSNMPMTTGVNNLSNHTNITNLNNIISEQNINENPPNKIDIKISVNYGKSTQTTNSLTNSKSFMQNTPNYYKRDDPSFTKDNLSINNGLHYNSINSGISPMNKVPSGLKEKLIKSLKTNADENLFKKKLIDPKREYNEMLHSTQSVNSQYNSSSNIHKRNQSVNSTYYQNNLNISLMNYDNPNKLNFNNNYSNNFNQNYISKNLLNTSSINHQSPNIMSNSYTSSVISPQNESFLYNNTTTNNNYKKNPLNEETKNKIENLENISINTENYPTSNMNEFTLNRNDNDFLKVMTTVTNDNKSQMIQLEKNLEESLKNLKIDQTDKINLSVQKFSIYQSTLNEYMSICVENGLIKKVHEGFNEVLKNIIASYNSKINDKTVEIENLSQSYKNVTKKYTELYKAYQEKSEENKLLRSKFSSLKKETSKEIPGNLNSNCKPGESQTEIEKSEKQSPNTSSIQNNCVNGIPINTSNNNMNNMNHIQTLPNELEIPDKNKKRIINLINKNMLDDLDSIHFFDKINMRTKSATHNNVPKLNFNFLESDSGKNKTNNIENANEKEGNMNHNILKNTTNKNKLNTKISYHSNVNNSTNKYTSLMNMNNSISNNKKLNYINSGVKE